jgi:hypothetical protein
MGDSKACFFFLRFPENAAAATIKGMTSSSSSSPALL